MPKFVYSGDDGRYYSELGLTVNDGDEVELDADPGDGRFTPADPGKGDAPEYPDAPDAPDAPEHTADVTATAEAEHTDDQPTGGQ